MDMTEERGLGPCPRLLVCERPLHFRCLHVFCNKCQLWQTPAGAVQVADCTSLFLAMPR